jgi:hypothetical protein
MFYSLDNRIISVDDRFPQRINNSLTFQVDGDRFPISTFDTGSNGFYFRSSIKQTVSVNWGDGTIESYTTSNSRYIGEYVGWTQDGGDSVYIKNDEVKPIHNYQDNNVGNRFITFTFESLEDIDVFGARYIKLIGPFPTNILSAKKLSRLIVSGSGFITTLPDLSKNRDLSEIDLGRLSEDINSFNKIPESFFETNPKIFRAVATFDLSNLIASNLFRIGEMTNLEQLDLSGCFATELDESFGNLTEIRDLRLLGNPFTSFPEPIAKLPKMYRLYLHLDYSVENASFPDFKDLVSLTTFYFISNNSSTSFNLQEIPLKWAGLVKLSSFVLFRRFIKNNEKFNEFIENFYTLCTENGFLDPSSTEAQNTGFPEQFRDISWGDGSDWFTLSDPIQAPSGFSLGISNGTPANNAEKIYVLVENYGHTVELAP